MTDQRDHRSKGITPPKGRPTRARHDMVAKRRVFGATAQWIALIFLIALIFVTVLVLLDGGDFNVFNNDPSGG